jgi:class 3 adenylate cyclase/tetratricopeptide (TPR) repeat protein
MAELPEGIVTILFTDTVGSTALAAEVGDRPARERMRIRETLAREHVARHRGLEIKSTGDGMMAAFTSTRRALDCAIEIQRAIERLNLARPREFLQLRIGIHTGEVFPERGDLHGSTVNAAARIESMAEPGGVLVSETVRMLLEPGSSYQLRDRGEFQLKGFGTPWRLFAVDWREPQGAPATLDRSPLVGRLRECAVLRQWLELAAGGRGLLGLLLGEPGIGKSRLAEEATTDARARGFLALIGRCQGIEGPAPYLPFLEILETAIDGLDRAALSEALADDGPQAAKLVPRLRELFPEMPAAEQRAPELERRFLLEGVSAVFARLAKRQPLLLVLEDLHWADSSTLLLLQRVTQKLATLPLLVLGTYRDTELLPDLPLKAALPQLLRSERVGDLRLTGLPPEAVTDLLRAFGGSEAPPRLVTLLLTETEGNPLFVEQVLKHLAEEGRLFDEDGAWRTDARVSEDEVPRGVRHVIGQRLQHVTEECRRALTSAAIFGRAFSFEHLRDLGANAADELLLDALDEAQAAQLIAPAAPGDSRLAFSHELFRQTLLSQLSPPRRQRLHLRAADVIEAAAGAQVERHAAELAYHLREAGAAAEPSRAVRYFTMAGRQALAATAFEDARRLFDDALARLGEAADERAELLYLRGLAAFSAGQWSQTEPDWRLALEAAERTGAADLAGRVAFDLSNQLAYQRRAQEAYAIAERGLRALGHRSSSVHAELRAYFAASGNDFGVHDYQTAQRQIDEALEIAARTGDPATLGRVLSQRAHIYWRHMLMASCAKEYERALEALDKVRDTSAVAHARAWLFLARVALGEFDKAARGAEGLEQFCERAGELGPLFATRRARAFMNVTVTGDLAQWNDFAAADLALLESLGSGWTANSHCCIALGRFWDGRWDEAWPHARQAAERALEDSWAGFDFAPLLLLHAYSGDREATRALFEKERRHLPAADRVSKSGGWELLPAVVEALAVIDDRGTAAALYPVARAGINDEGRVRYTLKSLPETTAGIAASCAGDWRTAEQHFEAALVQAEQLPNRIEQADARRWFARLCMERAAPGDRERAHSLLSTAAAHYHSLGMPRHRALAERMLEIVAAS